VFSQLRLSHESDVLSFGPVSEPSVFIFRIDLGMDAIESRVDTDAKGSCEISGVNTLRFILVLAFMMAAGDSSNDRLPVLSVLGNEPWMAFAFMAVDGTAPAADESPSLG
jgi:hypothetical protein